MDQGLESPGRKIRGGIISLAKSVMEYREAIEYDLLVETGHELRDVGRVLSWDALSAFLKNIDADSATAREINPELSQWSSIAKTNAILADIFDILSIINANLMAIGSGKRAKKPKPYPRPKQKDNDNKQHFGRGALPPDELRKWFEKKRTENKCQK